MEPTATGALLAKFGTLIFGFVGSILSLAFLRDLSRKQAAVAVLTGFITSQATGPLVVAYFGLPADSESRYGVAFLIGLMAMNLIPAVKATAIRLLGKWGA
jgi:hypothetical protein